MEKETKNFDDFLAENYGKPGTAERKKADARLNKIAEDQEQINWYDDYVINETINEALGNIFGAYSRLQSNHPNHPDFDKWKEDVKLLIKFERSLINLFIPTKEEAEQLMNQICTKSKALRELEKELKA